LKSLDEEEKTESAATAYGQKKTLFSSFKAWWQATHSQIEVRLQTDAARCHYAQRTQKKTFLGWKTFSVIRRMKSCQKTAATIHLSLQLRKNFFRAWLSLMYDLSVQN
jgi:hypothetical protein